MAKFGKNKNRFGKAKKFQTLVNFFKKMSPLKKTNSFVFPHREKLAYEQIMIQSHKSTPQYNHVFFIDNEGRLGTHPTDRFLDILWLERKLSR